MATIKQIMWGIRLHDVRDSYLDDPATSTVIRTALGQTLASCTLGTIDVTPDPITLTPNTTQPLSATLRDANGDPLDGFRRVTWSLRNNTMAVDLTAPNTLLARYVGDGTVQAATTTRATQTSIRVEPSILTVSAAATRWYQMWRIPNTYVPGSSGTPLPEWLAGTRTWTNDDCSIMEPIFAGTASATYGQVCFEKYDVVATNVENATRYEFVFFHAGDFTPLQTETRTLPTISVTRSSPTIAWNGLPPLLADRVDVNAFDATGHLLAAGHGCIRGCKGWPDA